jgi:hypothetical protein
MACLAHNPRSSRNGYPTSGPARYQIHIDYLKDGHKIRSEVADTASSKGEAQKYFDRAIRLGFDYPELGQDEIWVHMMDLGKQIKFKAVKRNPLIAPQTKFDATRYPDTRYGLEVDVTGNGNWVEQGLFDTKREAESMGKSISKKERMSYRVKATRDKRKSNPISFFPTQQMARRFAVSVPGASVFQSAGGRGWAVSYPMLPSGISPSGYRSNPADAIALLEGYEFHESVAPDGSFAVTVVDPSSAEAFFTEMTSEGITVFGEDGAVAELPDEVWDQLEVLYARGVAIRSNPHFDENARVGARIRMREGSGYHEGYNFHRAKGNETGTLKYKVKQVWNIKLDDGRSITSDARGFVVENPLTGVPSHDIPLELRHGRTRKQAVAIAMSAQRRAGNPTAGNITSGTLPKVHYSMGQSNASVNRSAAMKAVKAGMTPEEIHKEWPRIWSLSDGKLAQIYDSEFAQHPGAYETKYTMANVSDVIKRYKKPRGRKNPSTTDAAALYETFHGEPSTETIEYHTEEFERVDLATLGDLIQLKVETTTGKLVELNTPDPAVSTLEAIVKLASSPDGAQLYFVGGDQSIPYEDLGFGEADVRDHMVIGLVCEVTYRTRKGFDNFEETDYYHETGEETKVKKISDEFRRKPTLIYNPHDQTMKLAGGMYRVKDVGICN